MTQYDMIYSIVSDNRFVDSVGNVFTEIGCVDSREAYKAFLDREFKNEEEVDSSLASFINALVAYGNMSYKDVYDSIPPYGSIIEIEV